MVNVGYVLTIRLVLIPIIIHRSIDRHVPCTRARRTHPLHPGSFFDIRSQAHVSSRQQTLDFDIE